MKRMIIANASPSLVLPSKITEKALLAAISDFTKSISFWWIMGMNSARWIRDVKRWPYFSKMVANCWLLKGEYLPSVELPQAHIDRASCVQVMWILLLLRLFLQDPWYFDLLAFPNILQRFDVLYGWYMFLDRTLYFGKIFSAGVVS